MAFKRRIQKAYVYLVGNIKFFNHFQNMFNFMRVAKYLTKSNKTNRYHDGWQADTGIV